MKRSSDMHPFTPITSRALWLAVAAIALIEGVIAVVHVRVEESLVRRAYLAALTTADATRAYAEFARMVFVGDIMLGRGVSLAKSSAGGDETYPFQRITPLTSFADISFGNLEGPVSDRGANVGSIYSFRFDPSAVRGLSYAGFDAVSLANNHIWDWGRDALIDTLWYLERGGIAHVGAGENEESANEPLVVPVRNTRVGFLAYTTLYPPSLHATGDRPGISSFSLDKARQRIAELKQASDIVVVSMHWGDEYQPTASEEQRAIGRALIIAGADLVVGHHPHVVQEIEYYPRKGKTGLPSEAAGEGGLIAYSLGNFVFDQAFSPETMRGAALRVEVRDKKISRIVSIPIQISETFQPYESGEPSVVFEAKGN